jgi:CHAT domain-containing protein/Tfp pilus assembly protein PilF
MGYIYDQLGSKQEAVNYYNQALSTFLSLGDKWGACLAVLAIARDQYSLGDKEKALVSFQQALSASRALGKKRLESHILRDIGLVYQSLGATTRALEYYHQSLAFERGDEDRRDEAYTFNNIGLVFEAEGQRQKALDYYNQALLLNRESDDRFGETDTLYNIASIERNLGELDDAMVNSEQALKIVESLRTNVVSQDLRSSYIATAHQQYELYLDVLMQLHKQRPAKGFDVAALETSERGRARSLLESLKEARADIREGVDPVLLEKERSLEQGLNAKAERHSQLAASKKSDEAQAVVKEIEQLTREYEEVEAQVKSKSPRYAALMQPQPLSLQEIQHQLLDDNTVLLEYALGDERSYLWAVTRTEVSSFELPGRAQIEDSARRFYRLLTANQPVAGETFEQRQARVAEANVHISEEAAALSKVVLGPVMSRLGTKRLLIVPDGALQYIPFQALVAPGKANTGDASAQPQTGAGSDEQIPLIVDHEIVNEPSASALALVISETAQRKPGPKTIAVLANPVFEADDPRVKSKGSAETQVAKLSQQTEVKDAFRDAGFGEGLRIPPLPASRDEANAIMAMAPWGTGFKAEGFEASRATIMRPELGQYRIVHFATHGFVDYEHPELSGLVLSLVDEKGNPQDGFLRMHDIYNLKLPADLVVLSACNTGLGKEVKGEGLIGLTRGFMYAGAAGVAASLWKVDDEATAELMKRFYEGMFQKGLTPAAALREAQLGMWRQKRWHAPYYWAAFVIQGQYNQKENMNLGPTRTVKWAAALGGLAAAVSLVLFFLLRQRRRRIL